jgi:hypothetical protein
MTAEFTSGHGIGNRKRALSNMKNSHHRDSLTKLKVWQTSVAGDISLNCRDLSSNSFVIPPAEGRSRRKAARRLAVLEFVVYVLVSAAVIYSVAANSLLVLTSAITAMGLYIVMSHLYEHAVKTRQEIAGRNYLDLLYQRIGRN